MQENVSIKHPSSENFATIEPAVNVSMNHVVEGQVLIEAAVQPVSHQVEEQYVEQIDNVETAPTVQEYQPVLTHPIVEQYHDHTVIREVAQNGPPVATWESIEERLPMVEPQIDEEKVIFEQPIDEPNQELTSEAIECDVIEPEVEQIIPEAEVPLPVEKEIETPSVVEKLEEPEPQVPSSDSQVQQKVPVKSFSWAKMAQK